MRETGLEPVRTATHAPQTCASADSATLAYAVRRLGDKLCEAAFNFSPDSESYYIKDCPTCQYFLQNFLFFLFRLVFANLFCFPSPFKCQIVQLFAKKIVYIFLV